MSPPGSAKPRQKRELRRIRLRGADCLRIVPSKTTTKPAARNLDKYQATGNTTTIPKVGIIHITDDAAKTDRVANECAGREAFDHRVSRTSVLSIEHSAFPYPITAITTHA